MIKHSDLVYDAGFHRGEDTAFYLKKGFRVVAFEANAELIAEGMRTFADQIGSGRLVIVQGAIIGRDAWESGQRLATFYMNRRNSVWGTIRSDWAARNARSYGALSEQVTVPAIDFAHCFATHGVPHYLKIDIEGLDAACLDYLVPLEVKPDYISIESNKTDFSKLAGEIAQLAQLGYDGFQAVQQQTVPKQVIPRPPREGRECRHVFPFDASGLFGQDLPDDWLNANNVLQRYHAIFKKYALFGDASLFRRNKAGRAMLRAAELISGMPLPGWYDTHARHKDCVRRLPAPEFKQAA